MRILQKFYLFINRGTDTFKGLLFHKAIKIERVRLLLSGGN